jgi:hypothetical protein
MIRNHELIHARITPRVNAGAEATKAGLTVEALQWSEDYRVGLIQARRGLVDRDALSPVECQLMAGNVAHDRRLVAGSLLSLLPLHDQRERMEAALVAAGWDSGDLADIRSTLHEITDMAYAPFRDRRRASMKRKPTGFRKITVPLASYFDHEFPVAPPPSKAGDGKADPKIVEKLDAIRGIGKWGKLTDVHRLKLTRAVKPRRPLGRRFADTGVIPSAVHRLPVDGAIFTTKRRQRGGSILCDNSGSMSYDDSDIERIIRNAPAAMIAFYAGGRRGGKPMGRIVIAADRGRAATVDEVERAMPGGENYVDGPALRWLARQPAPRYWVSDEGVGGVSDFGVGGPCWHECRAICRAANITIVPSIDAIR